MSCVNNKKTRLNEKITNRHINNEEYENQKCRLKVILAAIPCNLKALFAFSKFIRTSDRQRMMAEVMIKSYMQTDIYVNYESGDDVDES